MYKNVSFWLVSVGVLLLTGNLGFGQTLIDDGFDGGGLGVGDGTSINGGFTLTANSISAGSAVAESDSCAEVVTTGGANGNAGICSNTSFDPLSTAALSKGLTVEWVVSSLSEATSANGNTYTIQPDNAFFNGIPYVGVMFSGKAGTTPDGVRFVGKTTGGDPTHNLSALYNYDQTSFLDGFTVRFTISETGWVFEVEGLDVPVLEEGSWSDFHPRDVLDSDSFVSAHAQTPGADLVARYDRCTVWIGRKDASRANAPKPEEEAADVSRDSILAWNPGEYAVTHDVYFATVFDDVNDADRANPLGVLVSQSQDANTYDPGRLEFGQTYYWRVDEVNGAPDNTIFKGTVWSFTTEPLAYPIAGVVATSNGTSDTVSTPQRTVDGSGINANDQASTNSTDMWLATAPADEALYIQYEFDRIYKLHELLVWNYNVQFEPVLGFGIKDVTVEYSVDGREWITLGDAQFARATATTTYTANTTVDLGGVAAQFVRLNINSGWGMLGQYGLSEVRFTSIPVQAREPEPADGAADVDPDSALSWRAGRDAVSHDVYLGTDPDGVSLIDTTGDTTVTPGTLEFGTTYYWRVDETVDALWTGDLWSFSTKQYELIDGFETYTDDIEAGEAIFDTWLDGWVNDNGSTVGYFDAPFAEKTIVHSGSQSMPLAYDNSASPFYAEAERTFDLPQDWTGNGADTLVLYVRGNAPDFVEAADGSIVMSAIGTDIWDVSDQFRFAYKNLSGDGSMTVRVDSIIRSNEWAKAGVMIRETLEPGSKHAFAAATPEPSHGLSFQRRPVAGQASANTDVADISLPEWVRLTRTGNIFTMAYSNDGVTWTDVVASPAVDIQMNANVYIGLALCSHDAAIVTAAEMSNVSTTGNVSGAWQLAEIGVAQPVGNSAEPMYVRIEDSAGKTKTVVNADAAITARPSWQEWAIPYSDLAGVELSRVEKMYIGVGSKTTPKAGGAGIVYVDDIGYGRNTVE